MSLAKSMEILKIRESPLQNQWKLSKNANALRKNYMFMNSESGEGGSQKNTKHFKKNGPRLRIRENLDFALLKAFGYVD
jgi:hypothetical protein